MSEIYDWQQEGDFGNSEVSNIPRSIKWAAGASVATAGLLELNQAIHNTHLPLTINLASALAAGVLTHLAVERNVQSATFQSVQL